MKKILAVMMAAVLAVVGTVPAMTARAGDSDENYDVTKPVINSIEIDKQGETLTVGDTVTIYVDAYDVGVGIDYVEIMLWWENKSGGSERLYWNENVMKYERVIDIDSNSSAGKYYITGVLAKDINGNYMEKDVFYWYNVERDDIKDKEAPVVESIHLTKNGIDISPGDVFSKGDIIHISIKAIDNVELANTAEINFRLIDKLEGYYSQYDYKYIRLPYLEDTQCYEGSFEINDWLYPGTWKLSDVDVEDTSKNRTCLANSKDKIMDIEFKIQNDDFDTEPPILHSFSIDRAGEFVRSGDCVKITAEITDNRGINYARANLCKLIGIDEFEGVIYLEQIGDTNIYEGIFEIKDNTDPCEWYLHSIEIDDSSRNCRDYFNSDMNQCVYVVQGKDTFVNPTYKVDLRYEENGQSHTKKLEVPRRTTAKELAQYFTPQNSKFIGWDVPGYGVLDNGSIYALYDETLEDPSNCDETESTEETTSEKTTLEEAASEETTLEETTSNEADNTEEIINKGDIFTIGELQYRVIENGEVSVYSTLNKMIIDINIPKMVIYGGKEWKVINIGSSALKNCNNLIRITIPEGITSIEDSAFKNCKSLTDIKIPEGVTSIGNSAFKNCKNLAGVTIPESVISIADDAFTNTAAVIYSTDNAYARTYAKEHKLEWKSLKTEEPTNTEDIPSDESGSMEETAPMESDDAEEETTMEIPTASAVLSEQQIVEAVSKVTATEAGSTIKISMGRATVVPKDILEAARGKDVNIVLEMEGYTWTINGTTVLSKNLEDINLEVTRHTNYIPNRIVSALAGSNPVEQISLTHNGHFGFTANLTLNVGNQYAGQDGNLYYYDSDGKMVFINAGTIDNNGNVSLAFSHASDYAIVITKKQVSVMDGTDTATLPETGDTVPMKLFALLVVSVGTIVFVNIMGKKNKIKQ
ncbi:MAG: leucine-rich repeat domain-containing protein [Lachnospiraceae bacterium]|nr:leucine-rich repeat domain-containing protein [Lachnospiraceae bacterium]